MSAQQHSSPARENDEDGRRFVTDMLAALSPDDPPIVGREVETDRIWKILSRKSKNGVALVGEPGVGKTAVVRSLAWHVAMADAALALLQSAGSGAGGGSCQVLALSPRGYKADYVDLLLRDIEQSGRNVILFIDNVHVLLQRCGVEDGPGILEDILSREYLRCIVATTPEQYQRCIGDGSGHQLEALQKVVIREPSVGEACKIIQEAHRHRYEMHHSVKIPDGAITAAVELAKQHATSRALPDSVLDLIDEAATTAPRSPLHSDGAAGGYDGEVTEEHVRRVVRQKCTERSQLSSDDKEELAAIDGVRRLALGGPHAGIDALNAANRNERSSPDAKTTNSPQDSQIDPLVSAPNNPPSSPQYSPQITKVAIEQQSSSARQEGSDDTGSHAKTKVKGLKRLFHRKKESKSLDLNKTSIDKIQPPTKASGGSDATPRNEASVPSKTSERSVASTKVSSGWCMSKVAAVEEYREERKAGTSISQKVNTFQRSHKRQEKEAARLLKANGFDPKSQKSFKVEEALKWAATDGSDTVVEYLLSRFGRKLGDWGRGDALLLAAQGGHVSTVEFLLNQGGVNLAARDRAGTSLFHRVVSNAGVYSGIVRLVLDRGGANLVARPNDSGRTALHTAAFSGYVETMLLLIDHGANIHAADNGGLCPLHLAARGGHVPAVKTLLTHGADIEAQSAKNLTPLFGAAEKGCTDVIALLIQSGASVKVRETEHRHTPLHQAVKHGHAKAARLLIDGGVSPFAKDRSGNTAVDMARTYWNREPFEQLVQFIKQRRQMGARESEMVGKGRITQPAGWLYIYIYIW